MFYKTAYKYGAATIAGITGAMIFATGAEWLGIKNSLVFDLFKGTGADNVATQITILSACIAIFAILNIAAYNIAIKQFEKVDI